MEQSTAIYKTMHSRVAIIKAVGSQASKEEIISLLEKCLSNLSIEATGDIKADTQTIVKMTGDGAFERVMNNYIGK